MAGRATSTPCWSVERMRRANDGYSKLVLQGRQQAVSHAAMAVHTAVVRFREPRAWAAAASVNCLGLELAVLRAAARENGLRCDVSLLLSPRPPLLPAGAALKIWERCRFTGRKADEYVRHVNQELNRALDEEKKFYCDLHRQMVAGEAAMSASGDAHGCGKCFDAGLRPPKGLRLLLQLLRQPHGAFAQPFYQDWSMNGPNGFLGAGSFGAVFSSEDGKVVKVFFDSRRRRDDERAVLLELEKRGLYERPGVCSVRCVGAPFDVVTPIG